jgi:hypothetical protein
MKSKMGNFLFICFMFPLFNASAAFYTVDQSFAVPGMPGCHLILVSVWDDMNTSDASDDRHMRTDGFLSCGNQMNSIPCVGNFNDNSGNLSNSTATLLLNLSSFFSSLFEQALSVDDKEFVEHLIKKTDNYAKVFNSGDKSIFIDFSVDLPEKFRDRIEYNVNFTYPVKQDQGIEEFREIKH